MDGLKTYRVLCVYRKDDGMNYCQPTDREVVTVQARDIYAARAEAIDAMYAKHKNTISHVQTGIPKPEEVA